jgi:hypothetical protein
VTERVPIERQVLAVEALLTSGEIREADLKGVLVFLKWAEKNQDVLRAANNAEVMGMVQAVLANPAVLEVKKVFPGAMVDLSRSRTGQTNEL